MGIKKSNYIFLGFLLLFSLFLTSCRSSDEIDNILKNSEDILNSESNINYSEKFREFNLELRGLSESMFGSSVVGTQADLNKADFIELKFKDLNLSSIRQEPITLDGWQYDGVSITFPCTCEEEELEEGQEATSEMTLRQIGVYPCNFNYNNLSIDLVNINQVSNLSLLETIDKIDVEGKSLLISSTTDIEKIVQKAYEKGAVCVFFEAETPYSIMAYYYHMVYKFPIDFPVFLLSNANYNLLLKYMEDGHLPLIITGVSTLKENVETSFVIGEIEGREKNKYIYVTANRDTLEQGFLSSSTSISQLYYIARELKLENYTPKYTIRFMITTGQEFGSIDNPGYNRGIEKYLDNLSDLELSRIKGVYVIDGTKPLYEIINTTTEISNSQKLFDAVTKYNDEFVEKGYRFKNSISEISNTLITEALVWNKKGIPVLLQAEDPNSDYLLINNTSADTSSLILDQKCCEFLVKYYTGVIKVMEDVL